jgi:ankyrin repeat protein
VTALMEASRAGDAAVVKRLLEAGADVNAAEGTHAQTALMWAVGEGHASVVDILLQAGAKIDARTPARPAMGRECCQPNWVGGFTALLFAAQRGDVAIAKALLARGANVNDEAADNSSALLIAIESAPVVGDRVTPDALRLHAVQERMAAFLLENGANPNLEGAGRTALHAAVQRKMPKLVSALLARGANPNARITRPMPPLSRPINIQNGLEVNTVGATPFWLAASYGDAGMMRALLAGGADPLLKSKDNTTALMVAAGIDFIEGQDKYGVRWFREDATFLQQLAADAIKVCLDAGIDVNAVNDRGQTALFGAVYLGGTTVAKLLVDNGARIDVINKRGQTPWMVAVKGEYRAGSFYTHRETGEFLETLGANTTLGKDLGSGFERAGAQPE